MRTAWDGKSKKMVRREEKGREVNKPSVSAGDETDCRTETEGKASFLYFEVPYLSARAEGDLTTASNLCSAVASVAIPPLYIFYSTDSTLQTAI